MAAVAAAAVVVLSTFVAAAPAKAATPVAPLGIAAGGVLPYASQAARDSYLSAARDLGATWLRFDIPWNDIQPTNSTNYNFARYDKVVADAQRYGLQVVGLLGFAPRWAQDPSCAGNHVCKPRSAKEYGAFAGAVAAHFGPRGVHHWEMWNEPNQMPWFAPQPNATDYANMLKAAYPQVHAADSKAQVIFAGSAPAATGGGNISPIDFLSAVYAAGGGDSFDIVGVHPYCFAGSFDCPNKAETWSAWTQMAQTKVSLRSVMAAHGDGKLRSWATEFGAPTNGDGQAVSEGHQGSMIVDALKLFGQETWSGPLFVHNLQDSGTNTGNRENWFGILRADGSRKPAYAQIKNLMNSSEQRSPGTSDGSPQAAPPAPAPAPTTAAPKPVVTTPAPVGTPVPVGRNMTWWNWLLTYLMG